MLHLCTQVMIVSCWDWFLVIMGLRMLKDGTASWQLLAFGSEILPDFWLGSLAFGWMFWCQQYDKSKREHAKKFAKWTYTVAVLFLPRGLDLALQEIWNTSWNFCSILTDLFFCPCKLHWHCCSLWLRIKLHAVPNRNHAMVSNMGPLPNSLTEYWP